MRTIGDNDRRDLPEDLVEACDEFLQAARKYREFLKRHYRDRLHAVVYVESDGGELVLYSESGAISDRIKQVEVPWP